MEENNTPKKNADSKKEDSAKKPFKPEMGKRVVKVKAAKKITKKGKH